MFLAPASKYLKWAGGRRCGSGGSRRTELSAATALAASSPRRAGEPRLPVVAQPERGGEGSCRLRPGTQRCQLWARHRRRRSAPAAPPGTAPGAAAPPRAALPPDPMATEALAPWPGNGSRTPCPVDAAFAQRFLPAVYLVVIPLGLAGNGLGLWHLCTGTRRSNRHPLGLLVGNLGLADLLYVSTLPFLVSYYLGGRVWLFGHGWCRITRGLFHLNLYASIGFLTCISVHRYLGIVHPLKARGRCQGASALAGLSAMVWAWVIAQVAPDFAFSKMDDAGMRCHDTTGHESLGIYLPYTAAVTVTGFVIPFLIIIGCYCHVVVVLCRSDTVDLSLRRRSIRLVILVMVLFSICFLPYHIFRNLNLLSRAWQLQGSCTQALKNIYVSYQVTRGLASFNSALNPLLYVMTSEDCMSCMRTIHQRASQSLESTFRRKTSCQTDEKKKGIILCEEEATDEL